MHFSYVDVGSAGRVSMSGGAAARAGDEALWPASLSWPDWLGKSAALRFVSAAHRLVFRLSDGRVATSLRGGEVLLLTTTGRKTARSRTWPLCFLRSGDDVVVVASAAGRERHPGWYHNLRANPLVRVQVGRGSQAMLARTATGHDRARLWERLVQRYPVLAHYQRSVDRVFPVVVLQPVPAGVGM